MSFIFQQSLLLKDRLTFTTAPMKFHFIQNAAWWTVYFKRVWSSYRHQLPFTKC